MGGACAVEGGAGRGEGARVKWSRCEEKEEVAAVVVVEALVSVFVCWRCRWLVFGVAAWQVRFRPRP